MTGQDLKLTRTRHSRRPGRADIVFIALGAGILVFLVCKLQFVLPVATTDLSKRVAATPEIEASGPVQESAGPVRTHEEPLSTPPPQSLATQMGIEIVGVRLSVAGRSLDVRYKVLDAQKASRLAERGTRALIIDQATGRKLVLPGSPRRPSRAPLEGRSYYMIFNNTTPPLEKGSVLDLVIGDASAYNLTLQ